MCIRDRYTTRIARTNLRYRVLKKDNEEEKYNTVRDLLDEKKCPTIIYVSRTRRAVSLAHRLTAVSYTHLIDTLYLSPLLFPAKPYHALLKDDKLQTNDLNNPLNDSIKARDLFYDEVTAFLRLDDDLKAIFYYLLRDKSEFSAFFHFLGYEVKEINIVRIIRERFHSKICSEADLKGITARYPVELAYCLALINVNEDVYKRQVQYCIRSKMPDVLWDARS